MMPTTTRSAPRSTPPAHGAGGEEEKTPQDGTDSTTFDSEEHSDAPGPFGTG